MTARAPASGSGSPATRSPTVPSVVSVARHIPSHHAQSDRARAPREEHVECGQHRRDDAPQDEEQTQDRQQQQALALELGSVAKPGDGQDRLEGGLEEGEHRDDGRPGRPAQLDRAVGAHESALTGSRVIGTGSLAITPSSHSNETQRRIVTS
jgi:hypothetical protein